MKKITLILTFLALNLAVFAQAPRPFPTGLPTCLEDDFRELEKFYDATGGNNWTKKTGWLTDADMSKWFGITLTSNGCDVKTIFLSSNNLVGQLLDINFPALISFSCYSNQLIGNIPDFKNLPNLQNFDCSINKLSGSIPDFNLPNLQEFQCGRNQLSSSIPNFTKLTKLSSFSCSSNQLSGNIPNFTNLPSLRFFDCSFNQLSGNIPNFTKLLSLQSFSCSTNQLSGNIPDFTKLLSLQSFLCSGNQLSGNIPDFMKLPQLSDFDCSYNQLTGNIPNFLNIPNLVYFYCNNNQLSGNIPDFTKTPKLQTFYCNDNQMIGSIPNFTNLPKLERFYCNKNFFNFGNIDNFKQKINDFIYSPQKTKLQISFINNELIADTAGSTLNKLTYKWYKNSTLFATTINNNHLPISNAGTYYYAVNHSILTKLTLLSDSLTIGAVLKGKIFTDANNNCALDNSEKGRKEIILRFESPQDTVITVSDSLGNYQVLLDTFNYSIYIRTGNLWKLCALPNIKPVSSNDSITLNIPMQVKVSCPEMHVDLSTIRLRRCFDNTYTIKYSNKGTTTANNAYVIVDFDKWLTVKNASSPYTQLLGNQYRFNIGTVQSDEGGIITVVVNVNCDSTVLGQTHCSTAHIYPYSACVTSSLWDNSSLTIKAKCQGDKVTFEVKNEGTAPTSQARQSIVIEDQIMMFQTPVNLGSGESKFFEFSPFGKTVRMSIEQAEYHPSNNAFVSAAVEGCGGNPTLGMITQFSTNDNEPWKDTDCRQNIGAYDPNEKLAFPKGYGELHLIEPNTEIEYQINFQNLGTDTAFTVVLRDIIDNNLDITTINMVSSSHPYSWTLEDRNTLKVTFNHINLTTKKDDETKSQGFIRFRIAQNKDLPSGKTIKNRAGIYFDFNLPIMTNTTFHRVGRNFVLVAVPNVEISNLEVKVSPNPLHNQAIFEVKNADNQNFTLKIFDQLGRILHQQSTDNGQVIFQNTLSQGIYFYRIENEKRIASGKLMIY